MSFSHKWKQPRHFPFGQISLQSHVTTLNQPIRSLNSLKSLSSRRYFCDFVRFHPKFHPHLKSKAVRNSSAKNQIAVALSKRMHHVNKILKSLPEKNEVCEQALMLCCPVAPGCSEECSPEYV